MSNFEKLVGRGFRRLHDVELKLKPLNVLIGANGCGKTTILDVLSLLAASASGQLGATISEIGGGDANLTNLSAAAGKADAMTFELATATPGSSALEYRLILTQRGAGYEITEETLSHQPHADSDVVKLIESQHGNVRYNSPGTGPDQPTGRGRKKGRYATPFESLPHTRNETALSQVPKTIREAEEFRRRLASSTHYHVLDVSKRAPVRLPQPIREATLPGQDGEDLVSCLFTMRESNPDAFELVQDTLRAGFPSFERLSFPPVAAGMLAMTWKESHSNTPFYMHQLSDGTLRFLWLVTLLQSPGLSAVTLIDEPEVSLHPELLSLLADLMREASQRTQLVVATHSDRLIRFLRPEEVVTVDIGEEGAAQVTRAEQFDLEQCLDEYTLDEVWRLGRMGGRP